jgi:folate-binding protein YgfZ
MKAAFLPDRGVIKVGGEDARGFLDGLVTTNVALVRPGVARFGALLTPQGKIVIDFLVTEAPPAYDGGFIFDCPLPLAQTLVDKLRFYKLRARVTVENLSAQLGVLAVWDGVPKARPDLAFEDPRDPKLGWRMLVTNDLVATTAGTLGATLADSAAYEAHRIACGAPRGGVDFIYGDAFPHEANMDRLHGVDFDKGCYVGQEVVSRMEHRGTARTRTVRVRLDRAAPEAGITILAGDKPVGTMGSSANGLGLALMRVDRVTDALDSGLALTAGGLPVSLVAPEEARPAPKKASA